MKWEQKHPHTVPAEPFHLQRYSRNPPSKHYKGLEIKPFKKRVSRMLNQSEANRHALCLKEL